MGGWVGLRVGSEGGGQAQLKSSAHSEQVGREGAGVACQTELELFETGGPAASRSTAHRRLRTSGSARPTSGGEAASASGNTLTTPSHPLLTVCEAAGAQDDVRQARTLQLLLTLRSRGTWGWLCAPSSLCCGLCSGCWLAVQGVGRQGALPSACT